MSENEVNPFRKPIEAKGESLQKSGGRQEGEKWLEFEFHCVKGKAEEVLEVLYRLGHRRYILDNTIGSVVARWFEIINGNTGEVGWVGTYISGVCREDQQKLIVDAIFGAGAVERGDDYYLNRIHFWNPSTRRRIGER